MVLRHAHPKRLAVTCILSVIVCVRVFRSRLELWLPKWGFTLIIFILMSRKRAFSLRADIQNGKIILHRWCCCCIYSIKLYVCIGNCNSNCNTNWFQITCSEIEKWMRRMEKLKIQHKMRARRWWRRHWQKANDCIRCFFVIYALK